MKIVEYEFPLEYRPRGWATATVESVFDDDVDPQSDFAMEAVQAFVNENIGLDGHGALVGHDQRIPFRIRNIECDVKSSFTLKVDVGE
jgi:hypothetical protein